MSSVRFFLIFGIFLLVLLGAFWWFVQTAGALLPQENEVITVEEAAMLLKSGEIERVLVQEERDVFLYRPDEPRPLYTRLDAGRLFTETFAGLGVRPESFPPLLVEE